MRCDEYGRAATDPEVGEWPADQREERMGTQPPAVARLESALSSGKHSPSIDTLKRYAEAVGCELQIQLVPRRRTPSAQRAPRRVRKK